MSLKYIVDELYFDCPMFFRFQLAIVMDCSCGSGLRSHSFKNNNESTTTVTAIIIRTDFFILLSDFSQKINYAK